jgi:hypothetical protein
MGTRALEVIEWVYSIKASICIFTEVGELRNTNKLPHFNIFYQKGINQSWSVCITIGKDQEASHIEIYIPNTVVINLKCVSEPVRIIVIYWPNSQNRNLDDILSFIMQVDIFLRHFLLSGFFLSTKFIDPDFLLFSNTTAISCEILHFGSSDHWLLALTCENNFFDMRGSYIWSYFGSASDFLDRRTKKNNHKWMVLSLCAFYFSIQQQINKMKAKIKI